MMKSLAEASRDELVKYTTTVQNLPVEESDTAGDLRETLKAVGVEEIEVPDEAAAPKKRAPKAKAKGDDKPDTVTVIVAATENETQPVFVSVNGRAMYIKRDTPSEIGRPYYEALQAAEIDVPQRDKNGTITGWTKAKRYPVSVQA